MDYGAIIPLAAYFVAVQLATRVNINPLLPASVAVLIPYLVSITVKYILESGNSSQFPTGLFSLSSVLGVSIQFIVSVYVFKKLRDEDSLASIILWGIGGFIIIVLAIPYLVGLIRI